jgi:hypothetical protein
LGIYWRREELIPKLKRLIAYYSKTGLPLLVHIAPSGDSGGLIKDEIRNRRDESAQPRINAVLRQFVM